MTRIDWSDEKNEWLTRVRGISFEDILYHLTHGGLLDIIRHTNPERYPGQMILVVKVEEYVYLVPFVRSDNIIFLKTIIPSRKMTGKYLGERE
jgi:hypothetical protein